MPRETTRERIKNAARRLFAQRGLDNVSIRDIAKASGQKSSGAVNYHFRSREELIKEILRDIQRAGESRRVARLDAIEADGGPRDIREVIALLVDDETLDAASRAQDDHGLRFMHSVLINRRELLFDALRDGVDEGTRRCIGHLSRFANHLPPVLIRQRLILVISHIFAAAVAREAARFGRSGIENEAVWGHPAGKANLIDTVEAMLTASASQETLDALRSAETAANRSQIEKASARIATRTGEFRQRGQ